MKFPFLFRKKPRFRFERAPMAMVDLETFDCLNTAGFYAIAARMFKFGEGPRELLVDPDNPSMDEQQILSCPDFIMYIEPTYMIGNMRFTTSENTMRWTLEKNRIEYDRAMKHGVDPTVALGLFTKWLRAQNPECMVSNSPSFDHEILRHAYRQLELGPMPMGFRSDFDVRTIGHLRKFSGMQRYPVIGERRLHSPLDDCTLQIQGLAEFVQHIEDRAA